MPDLVVTSINRSPTVLWEGEAVSFSAVVQNQGTGPTPAGAAVRVRFTLNNTNVFWSEQFYETLPPGASVLLSCGNRYLPAPGGLNRLRAEVDDAQEIQESNETNNFAQTTFTVLAPWGDTDGDGMD